VIGTDGFADTLVGKLRENGASPDSLVRSDFSITPVYLKVLHHGYGEIVMEGPRFDFENQKPMTEEDQDAVVRHVNDLLSRSDAVVIIDQVPTEDFGVITERVRKELLRLAREKREKVFYADSRTRIGRYRDLVIKPNRFEAMKALHPDWGGRDVSADEARDSAVELSRMTGRQVYLTLGEDGILVAAGGSVEKVAGIKVRQKTDIVGAGDSATAGIVLALTAGATDLEAADVGNLVASITITKIGVTGTATPEEVLGRNRECTG
jgi:bifunctional ADP-heptose synthase (sugar kinase/adenylyltransferase)